MRIPDAYPERAYTLASRRGRTILGLAGAPGTGKSTIARLLREALNSDAVVVFMDGFHKEPIADAISIAPDVPLVTTNSNHVLLGEEPWPPGEP